MQAETITLHVTIRPSYAEAAYVKQEIEDSLSWLSVDHSRIAHAITLAWGEDSEGEWPDAEDDEDG